MHGDLPGKHLQTCNRSTLPDVFIFHRIGADDFGSRAAEKDAGITPTAYQWKNKVGRLSIVGELASQIMRHMENGTAGRSQIELRSGNPMTIVERLARRRLRTKPGVNPALGKPEMPLHLVCHIDTLSCGAANRASKNG